MGSIKNISGSGKASDVGTLFISANVIELSKLQQVVLDCFVESPLKERFYWTGGTALATIYLHHRQSNDVDLFTSEPFSRDVLDGFLKLLRQRVDLPVIDERKVFDRWEFFLHNGAELRLEFVRYDHPAIAPREVWNGIPVDSLDDIAANKVMALLDRNEPKDAYDMYVLLTKGAYTPDRLLALADKKFGTRYEESLIWSEALKSMRDTGSLRPIVLGVNDEERNTAIQSALQYFEDHARSFLRSRLA